MLPNLRKFIVEPDKLATLCTNLIYYVVSPAMKSKNRFVEIRIRSIPLLRNGSVIFRVLEVDTVILDILTEMVKIPSAVKAWRNPITDAFNDNRFFNSTPVASARWRPLIRALMDSDKTVFAEVISEPGSVSLCLLTDLR